MRNPFRVLLDLFSSIRFGVGLLVALFFYMSIGSAGLIYPVEANIFRADAWRHEQIRQRPWLEMTEFEWFHWWPFDLMLALLVTTMVVTTLRRIPLKPVNYGVWMIHTGVVVLVVGSVMYFSTKVEGEAPVARRAVVLSLTEGDGSVARVLAMPGNAVRVGGERGGYEVEVLSTDPAWEMLSGEDKGLRAFSVNLLVTTPDGRRFVRQLIDGHPEYTEDLVFTENREQPMQRAVRVHGEKLMDSRLVAAMEYESTGWFYLRNDISKAWALYVRRPGETAWAMRPIDGLPFYNDWLSSFDDVGVPEGLRLPPRPLDVRVPPAGENDPLPDITFTIDGYLRYAFERTRVVAGARGSALNPMASFIVRGSDGTQSTYSLAALDPEMRSAEGGVLRFRTVPDEAAFERLLEPPTLHFRIPTLGVDERRPVKAVSMVEPSLAFTPIGDESSGYSYRVVALEDDVALSARPTSLAIVELRTPSGSFRRWVFDDPAVTRDAPTGSSDPHGAPSVADEAIQVEYAPGSGRALVLLAAGPEPDRLRAIGALGEATPRVTELAIGQRADIGAGLSIELTRYLPRAVIETIPTIVPTAQRIRDAGELFSRVRIAAPGVTPRWIGFHPYVFDAPEERFRRTEFRPTTVQLEDGRRAEVIFSRQRLPLPSPIALDTFELTSHIGGFTGETSTIRDYTSVLRFRDADGVWGPPTPVSVNEPVEHGGYWYFQAKWDPPDEARRQGERASRGLNYTILGVGNRTGVNTQLAGCIIATLGMIYAFYVKPAIKRRRRAAVMQGLATGTIGAAAPSRREPSTVGAMRRDGSAARGALLLALALLMPGMIGAAASEPREKSFAERVDLRPLGAVAVHTEGRLKSYGSFANTMMNTVSGPRWIAGQSPSFTYLDMLLRPEAYADADVIFVKNKDARARLAQAWRTAASEAAITGRVPAGIDLAALDERLRAFEASGLISEQLLLEPNERTWRRELAPLMRELEGDLLRSARQVSQMQAAIGVKSPAFLLESLRVLPPGQGATEQPWRSIGAIQLLPGPDGLDEARIARAGGTADEPLPGIDAELQGQIAASWRLLVNGWRSSDAEAVNRAVLNLSELLPRTDPKVYPETARLWWESWYFRNHNMTRVWLVYMAAVVLLLLAIVYRWRPALVMGLGVFGIAFLLQTASVGLRWWISGRWPNSNMFEAVTTSAWMGAAAAVVLEILARRTAMRGLFALGGAMAGMVALMAAALMPVQLNPNISNMMPVLHDVWLYIHTNVIIFSYGLIFMAAVTAFGYLAHRAVGGAATFARVGGAGELMALAGASGDVSLGSGAGSAVGTHEGRASGIAARGARLGEVLDGVTMLLMEVSFVLLWAGIAMGAIWADHSWGRPWGWDPKEVFALNTFVIFAILIHVRLFAKDKGLWTAVLAVIGAGVMLFNWIVINFVITGLHSYA